MVSSWREAAAREAAEEVSIPFIAGQWSLPTPTNFLPRQLFVSIPFIAGQWSLPDQTLFFRPAAWRFQSPSLRGSGLFSLRGSGSCFGGVFQSPSLRGSGLFTKCRAVQHPLLEFQSPSLRGSGLFPHRPPPDALDAPNVSIPFIAGQWSLLSGASGEHARGSVSIPFIAGQWSLRARGRTPNGARRSFNPLHCGAVVSSDGQHHSRRRRHGVSIPFIAGQWSLLIVQSAYPLRDVKFQSPSLRGSGLFMKTANARFHSAIPFQSPSLRGSGLFRAAFVLARGTMARFNPLHCGAVVSSRRGGETPRRRCVEVSIPFIAGQWSLLYARRAPRCGRPTPFQSPSLRGSGLFVTERLPPPEGGGRFNPLHCGAVVSSESPIPPHGGGGKFQSPSLRGSGLFVTERPPPPKGGGRVSIPFIAGQWSLHLRRGVTPPASPMFQSPSLRGSGLFSTRCDEPFLP